MRRYSSPVPRNRTARTAVLGVSVRRPSRRKALVANLRRSPAAARRGRSRAALARARDALVPRVGRRPGRERTGGGRGSAAPVPGRRRSDRGAVPRCLRLGRRPVRRTLRRRGASEGERDPAPAGRAEPTRRARERPPPRPARVPRRAAFPRRLPRARDGRHLASRRHLRAGDRDRGRSERRRRRRRPGRDAGRARRDGQPRRLPHRAGDAPDRRPERRLGA